MKPAEKAIHLVQKFEGLVATPFDGKGNIRLNDSVRGRALICCDEIIQSYQQTIKDKDLYPHEPSIELSAKDSIKYWQQVKEEIYKL